MEPNLTRDTTPASVFTIPDTDQSFCVKFAVVPHEPQPRRAADLALLLRAWLGGGGDMEQEADSANT